MISGLVHDLGSKFRRFRNHHFPRYVFIHINKTAGSSIEKALNLRFEHKTAVEKRAELGDLRWNRAIKFAFVRNPWDRAVSHYHYRVQTNQTNLGDGHLAFRDWVKAVYRDRDSHYLDQPKMFQPQWNWISDAKGKNLMDFVGRFENLKSDMAYVLKLLNIRSELPHLKASERGDYRKFYDEETLSIISDAFRSDIREFGYSFEMEDSSK